MVLVFYGFGEGDSMADEVTNFEKSRYAASNPESLQREALSLAAKRPSAFSKIRLGLVLEGFVAVFGLHLWSSHGHGIGSRESRVGFFIQMVCSCCCGSL